jgi:DNA-binding beta-propeller fold protein YncE
MTAVLGSGTFVFRVEENWGTLPDGWELGDVGGVGVDDQDNVYVFNRGKHPMVVFDRAGNFITSWGEGLFTRPHGVQVAPDQTLYLTDDGDHTVRQCKRDGTVLLELGTPGAPAPFMSGAPFNRCTHTALSPEGDLYVSDGYGNARVHKYAPGGRLLTSWGRPGTGPGEFNLVHNISCGPDGRVYVADRENHRIQVFDGDGRYEEAWHDLHRPSALTATWGERPAFYVGECGPYLSSNLGSPNLGPRLSVLDGDGNVMARLGIEPAAGTGNGQFLSPHGIAADSRGDLYVGEVSATAWPSLFPGSAMPRPLRRLQKLLRVGQ